MMRVTRRGVMAGALAVPTVAGLASWRWAPQELLGEGSVLLHDPSLAAGRRFAEAGRAAGGRVLALEGDPIRLAQSVLRDRPALIAGISRQADALLVEEAAAEAGYVRVAALDGGEARCTANRLPPRMARARPHGAERRQQLDRGAGELRGASGPGR